MTLSDTGPIVALLNRNDPAHSLCVSAVPILTSPLVTTQACITESMYLLNRSTGFPGQSTLLNMIQQGRLVVIEADNHDMTRISAFMTQYRDIPCDYADATLLAAAERLHASRIFTLDAHFYAYKLQGDISLEVVPASGR